MITTRRSFVKASAFSVGAVTYLGAGRSLADPGPGDLSPGEVARTIKMTKYRLHCLAEPPVNDGNVSWAEQPPLSAAAATFGNAAMNSSGPSQGETGTRLTTIKGEIQTTLPDSANKDAEYTAILKNPDGSEYDGRWLEEDDEHPALDPEKDESPGFTAHAHLNVTSFSATMTFSHAGNYYETTTVSQGEVVSDTRKVTSGNGETKEIDGGIGGAFDANLELGDLEISLPKGLKIKNDTSLKSGFHWNANGSSKSNVEYQVVTDSDGKKTWQLKRVISSSVTGGFTASWVWTVEKREKTWRVTSTKSTEISDTGWVIIEQHGKLEGE